MITKWPTLIFNNTPTTTTKCHRFLFCYINGSLKMSFVPTIDFNLNRVWTEIHLQFQSYWKMKRMKWEWKFRSIRHVKWIHSEIRNWYKICFHIYIYRFSASLCIYVHYKTEHKNARTILNGNEVNSLVILLKHLRSKIFYFELIVFPMEKQIWTAILLKFRISFRFVSEMKSSMINVTINVYIPNSIAF